MPPSTGSPAPWAETRRRLSRDRNRLREWYTTYNRPLPLSFLLDPSYQCVLLHRISRYFFIRRWRVISRIVWHFNLMLTGADISPISDIGGGLVVVQPLATCIIGRMGQDCTVWGLVGIGGGLATRDIGAGPGLPILGDRIVIEFNGLVLGPVVIGDDVVVGTGCIVTNDVPANAILEVAESTTRPMGIRSKAQP